MENSIEKNASTKLEFEILVDESFVNFVSDKKLSPVENKKVLSLINDFEDGSWRFQKFENFIWDNITETALSFKERNSLVNRNHSSLTEAAKNLRLTDKDGDIGKGSELAEIVLYGIMKHHYGALPVVPKIFYKQNSRDNAKGADSVHVVIENGNDFSIWFGEAKFYDSIENNRLGPIVQSVEAALEKMKLKKENSIITSVSDLDDLVKNPEMNKNIRELLSPKESVDNLKPKLNIPILLLHECELTKNCNTLTEDYKQKIITHHKERVEAYFKKQIEMISSIHKYSEIKFHVILFPVPSKDKIVEKFVSTVGFYKN